MELDFDEQLYCAQPGEFPPFRAEAKDAKPLADASLGNSTELMVFQVAGSPFAIKTLDLSYHHVLQGVVDEEPFMVSFCGVCHSGALMDPRVNGKVHNFQCAGLYRGTAIHSDDETGTLWDHMTGKALWGSLLGTHLKVSPLEVTDVATALKMYPAARLFAPTEKRVFKRVMGVMTSAMQATGILPGLFTKTMPKEDSRLPRMTVGLGVVVQGEAVFFPMKDLKQGPAKEVVAGQEVHVAVRDDDGRPGATLSDGAKPLQYFLRWYGFALTFPGCSVYSNEKRGQ